MNIPNKSFFHNKAPKIASELIGHMLVRKINNKTKKYIIIETEAYDGHNDKASHASQGRTKRNEIMFKKGGCIYTYFTYGVHWMLNIVTGKEGYPSAVLIRAIVNVDDEKEILNGPAKLTKRLKIDGKLNGKMLGRKSGLWIEMPKEKISAKLIKKLPRVGIDYAGEYWVKKRWRYSIL